MVPVAPMTKTRHGFSAEIVCAISRLILVSWAEIVSLLERMTATKIQHFCYNLPMNSKQMKKWLEQQGATFISGKGSHLKVFLNGKQSALPMHGTTELGKGLEAAIKRQLGLK